MQITNSDKPIILYDLEMVISVIIIDDELFTIGSSIKDIGKKIRHISKLESINIDELLKKYEK